MHILFVAGRESGYERNEVLLRAFRRLGTVEVIACQHRPASLLVNSIRVAGQALLRLASGAQYDLVFVGFYGYLVAQLLAPFTRLPLLFDAFVSNYDTLCSDRNQFRQHSPAGRLAFWLDVSTCRQVAAVLLDTPQHRAYFVHTFGLPAGRVHAIPVGCNEEIFHFREQPRRASITRVLYYCTYLPLHGADIVIRAADSVRHLPIHLRLIGRGPEYAGVRRLADALALRNVTFLPPLSRQQLAQEIASTHICLGGHFGHSDKAARVIPGKVFQMLSVGRPVVAADAPGNRSLLDDGVHALLVPPQAPDRLAEALCRLHQQPDLRVTLGRQGHTRYRQQAGEQMITQQLRTVVAEVLEAAG